MSSDSQPEEAPAWQYEAHHEYFHKLSYMKFDLEDELERNTATLTREQLADMSIHVLEDLNVDDESPLDFAPCYFAPLPQADMDKFLSTSSRHLEPFRWTDGSQQVWRRLCKNPTLPPCHGVCNDVSRDPWYESPSCCTGHEAVDRTEWMMHLYQHHASRPNQRNRGVSKLANWINLRDTNTRRKAKIHVTRRYTCTSGNSHSRHIQSLETHEDLSGLVPHATALVTEECTFGETDVLLGDVLAAVALMRHQVRYNKHLSHRIFPVLLLAFQHDTAARIIQMHYDGHRLFIRQSRLLDLAADEPTPDAYLMLRWMASKPQGKTQYEKPVCVDNAVMVSTSDEPKTSNAVVTVHS